MSEESIKPPTKSSNSLAPGMTFFNGAKIKVKFDVGSLKQEKLTFHNVYFIYEINLWPNDLDSKLILLILLCDAVKLTEKADPDKYSYSGYPIGFVVRRIFSLSDGSGW